MGMLAAIIAVLFLGGAASNAVLSYVAETKSNVSDVIEEPDRRSEINATLGEMKKRSKAQNKASRQILKRLQGELGEHDANMAAIDSVLDEHLASLNEYNEDMIDLRFQLKDQLSRDEWAALFGDSN